MIHIHMSQVPLSQSQVHLEALLPLHLLHRLKSQQLLRPKRLNRRNNLLKLLVTQRKMKRWPSKLTPKTFLINHLLEVSQEPSNKQMLRQSSSSSHVIPIQSFHYTQITREWNNPTTKRLQHPLLLRCLNQKHHKLNQLLSQ